MGTARTGGHAGAVEVRSLRWRGELYGTVHLWCAQGPGAEFLERMADGGGPQITFRIVRASDLRFSRSIPPARSGRSWRRTTSPAVTSGGTYESVSLPLHGTCPAFGRRRPVRGAVASAASPSRMEVMWESRRVVLGPTTTRRALVFAEAFRRSSASVETGTCAAYSSRRNRSCRTSWW
jgi:hypothetical protein